MDRDAGMYKLKELKRGEFFKLKETSNRVYIKGEYDRSEKRYCCTAWDDANAWRMLDGNKLVYAGFVF